MENQNQKKRKTNPQEDSNLSELNQLKKEVSLLKNIIKKFVHKHNPLHQLSDQHDILNLIVEYLDPKEQVSFIKSTPKFEKIFVNFQILCNKEFPKFMKNFFSSRNQNTTEKIYQKDSLKNWNKIYEIFSNGSVDGICPICSSVEFDFIKEDCRMKEGEIKIKPACNFFRICLGCNYYVNIENCSKCDEFLVCGENKNKCESGCSILCQGCRYSCAVCSSIFCDKCERGLRTCKFCYHEICLRNCWKFFGEECECGNCGKMNFFPDSFCEF
jgi:hypothetical protein